MAGDASLDHIGEAVRRSIVDGVAQLTAVDVIPLDQEGDGASLAVGGSFIARGDSLEFIIEILDRDRNRVLPAPEPVRAPVADPLAAREEIRGRVMAALSHYSDAFGVAESSGRRPVSSYEAYQAFSEAQKLGSRGQWARAEGPLRRAVALEPTYTEAYLWLGLAALHNQPGRTARRGGPGVGGARLIRWRVQWNRRSTRSQRRIDS